MSTSAGDNDMLAQPGNMITVDSCALCGSSTRTDHIRDGIFTVVRCGACGLGYVTPRLAPDVLPQVYAEDYWSSDNPSLRGYDDYRHEAPLYIRTFEKRYRLVEEFTPKPGRALDIGCAAGFFLHVLQQRGWDVAGVEPSTAIARHATETYGITNIHVGDLAAAPFAPKSFDLITMWDVIEHIPEPIAFLETAVSLLKDDGVLILETQNLDSRFARMLGKRWHHYKHLEHLYHFDPKTIAIALDKVGLRVERLTPKYGGKNISMAFIRERATRLHKALRTPLKLLAPLDRVKMYVNMRDEMIVVARRASVPASRG